MTNTGLVKYDAMCHAIAVCHKVDEIVAIRDTAEQLRCAAKIAKNKTAERQAAEIRIRAERRAGQLLVDMRAKGARTKGNKPRTKSQTSLKNMHITALESSEWQRLAKVDSDAFEKEVTGPKPSAHAILVKHGGKKLPSKIALATTLIEGLAKDLNQLKAAPQTEIKRLLAAIDKLYDVLPVHQTNSEDQLLSKLKQVHKLPQRQGDVVADRPTR